jgi:hypothetical protein
MKAECTQGAYPSIISSADSLKHLGRMCRWCGAIFATGRRRGSAPRFCSAVHRLAFWAALRRRALADLEAGRLTIEMLKGGEQSVHALPARAGNEVRR